MHRDFPGLVRWVLTIFRLNSSDVKWTLLLSRWDFQQEGLVLNNYLAFSDISLYSPIGE